MLIADAILVIGGFLDTALIADGLCHRAMLKCHPLSRLVAKLMLWAATMARNALRGRYELRGTRHSMTEKHKQVALQCRAITHMADALAKVYSDYEIMFLTGNPQVSFVDQVGKRTAALMETLGNILNGMDATDESDDWMEPVFREAQRLWPQPTDPQ